LAFLKRKQKDVKAPPSHRYATASEMNEGGVPVSIIGEAFLKGIPSPCKWMSIYGRKKTGMLAVPGMCLYL
jgi:hypothetical protein